MDEKSPKSERLDSWKEIAVHLNRAPSTVQRWEKKEGLPVHRHLHAKLGSVYAYRSEVDAWWRERGQVIEGQPVVGRGRGTVVKAFALMVALVAGSLTLGTPRSGRLTLLDRPTYLTSLEGAEIDPALSPDGRSLAFAWDGLERARFDLYVMPVAGGTPIRLTQGGSVCCPAWDPSGRTLAFVRLGESQGTLMLISASGGPETRLVSVPQWFGLGVTWSGDGQQIVYPQRRSLDQPYSLVALSLHTQSTAQLTSPDPSQSGDGFPRYAPDGKTLAFSRIEGSGDSLPSDIYTLRQGDALPQRLTRRNALIGGLDWTWDGGHLIYAAATKGQRPRLWQVSATGDSESVLLEGPQLSETLAETVTAVSHHLRVSTARLTRRVAYVRGSYDTNIWRSTVPKSEEDFPRRVIASTQTDDSPQYSPDGKAIAIASSRSGQSEIWVCDRAGTSCSQMSRSGVHSGTPRWSPDGRNIAFDSRLGGQSDIYSLDVVNRQLSRITESTAEDVVPSWSADGRSLYFASNRSGRWEILRTHLVNGSVKQLTARGGFAAFEKGNSVYFTKYDQSGLWRVGINGDHEEKILEGPHCWGHWAIAGTGIYFTGELGSEGRDISFLSFGTRRVTGTGVYVRNLPCAEASLAVSPDGNEFLYARVEQSADIATIESLP